MTETRAISLRAGTLLAPQLDYILLDASGSMADKWFDTLAGIDAYMDVLRSQNIASHGILHLFGSTNRDKVTRDNIIAEWPNFVSDPATRPNLGMTPLYDAINVMGRRLRDLDPPRCTIVIVTDGDENRSETSAAQAQAILNWCKAKGWQVVFLGADFNNERQAKALGSNPRNTLAVQKQKLLEAGKKLGEKRVRNAQSGADIDFTDDEKSTFGGYLTGPSNAA